MIASRTLQVVYSQKRLASKLSRLKTHRNSTSLELKTRSMAQEALLLKFSVSLKRKREDRTPSRHRRAESLVQLVQPLIKIQKLPLVQRKSQSKLWIFSFRIKAGRCYKPPVQLSPNSILMVSQSDCKLEGPTGRVSRLLPPKTIWTQERNLEVSIPTCLPLCTKVWTITIKSSSFRLSKSAFRLNITKKRTW